ncbi:MAG: sporulation protein YabP [Clostridiales bacterium]|jgi:sporulation protein YabP|nr:sporulation protein YabP [Clostridiales bacterium]
MPEEKRAASKHTVTMDKKERAAITGVLDVLSFDEDTVIADTEMGIIILKGNALHVNRLNLDNGDLGIDGDIISLTYEDSNQFSKGKSSFLGKLFR